MNNNGIVELSRVRFHESIHFNTPRKSESYGFTSKDALILLIGASIHLINRDNPAESTSVPFFSARDFKVSDKYYEQLCNNSQRKNSSKEENTQAEAPLTKTGDQKKKIKKD